jgi:hypothetical protein
MEFGEFSIPLPTCKNTRRQIMSNNKISDVKTSNVNFTELHDTDLAGIQGGSQQVNNAITSAQMQVSTAMAKQSAITAMNDALNKSINSIGGSMKNAVG